MIAYACVYRRWRPATTYLEQTKLIANSNKLLAGFLDSYERSYFDWGDDPSFFAASQILGNVKAASWGVCRPDVRERLQGPGDFIMFFAGIPVRDRWEYYWIGLGTVGQLVGDRLAIWNEPSLSRYKGFLNLLIAPDEKGVVHSEHFRPVHKDWQIRIKSPYVVFEPSLSAFDINAPLHVSTYDPKKGLPDRWHSGDKDVEILETLLFKQRDRRLRTSPTGFGHAKLRLHGTDRELIHLRTELLRMVQSRTSASIECAPAPERTRSATRGCS